MAKIAKKFLEEPTDSGFYLEKMSEDLARFTEALETMSHAQARDIMRILSLLLEAVEKMGATRTAIDISDTRPNRWEIVVEDRDIEGFIKKVTLRGMSSL